MGYVSSRYFWRGLHSGPSLNIIFNNCQAQSWPTSILPQVRA